MLRCLAKVAPLFRSSATAVRLSTAPSASFKLPDMPYDYGELEPFVRALLCARRFAGVLRSMFSVHIRPTPMCRRSPPTS